MAVYEDILGSLVGERFRVTRPLGAGTFGQVFLAQHEIFDVPLRAVALKLFLRDHVTRNNARKVFKEALLLESLAAGARSQGEETHLVTVYEAGVLKDYQHMPYVAMEYVDGGSLKDRLESARRFPLQTVIRHVRDVCAGLRLAHEAVPAIIHRDLKPENVLITRSGFVKVADFGVAIDRYEAFLVGGTAGTITYSPPESRQDRGASPAWDVYSLGVMMIEMLSGENPLAPALQRAKEADRPVELELDAAQEKLAELQDPATGRPFADLLEELRLCKPFQKVLAGCLAWSPGARYPGARALDKALRACETGELIDDTGKPHETWAEKQRRLRRLAGQARRFGDLEQARLRLEEARCENPNDPGLLFELSEVYAALERWDEAIRLREEGLKPRRTGEGLLRLADLYDHVGKQVQARATRLLAKSIGSRG
jgi:serine/threonine protein kinase